MELESVTLKLSRELLSGAQRVASARDVSIGHMVRQLLKREVERQLSADRSEETDHRLVAAVQALLGRDLADATCWDDLAERLRPHGYELRPDGNGATLYKKSCGTRVCKGSELGLSYTALVKRFGSEMAKRPACSANKGVMPAGKIDPTRQIMLTGHFKSARSWPDLVNCLAWEGMELRLSGPALAIHIAATGRHLCNSDAVGPDYAGLEARYGKPLPVWSQDVLPATDDGSAVRIERS